MKKLLALTLLVVTLAACSDNNPDVTTEGASPDSSESTANPKLDRLKDGCADGDMAACDLLYAASDPDSEYEEFAMTCGERAGLANPCVSMSTTSTTTTAVTTPVAAAPTTRPPASARATTNTTASPTATTARPVTTSPPTTSAPPTTQAIAAPPGGSQYPPAPPFNGTDLDCPDIGHKVYVPVGNDPHGLDSDNDGVGCESYPG
jgi:hypothetical protein